MPLSHGEVIGLAMLARIEVSEAESAAVRDQLDGILGLVEQLLAVDTEGVEPMCHALDAAADATLRLREDEVTENDLREAFQAVAPRVARGLYLVPRVIE